MMISSICMYMTHADAPAAAGHGRAVGPVVGVGVVALDGAQTGAAVAAAHGEQAPAQRRHAARAARARHGRHHRPRARARVPSTRTYVVALLLG